MTNDISSTQHRRRGQDIATIDVPPWYWWGVALGWIAVGVTTDLGNTWATAAATLTFGALHAAVAHHVLTRSCRSFGAPGHADTASRHLPAIVLGSLVGLAALTVVLGVLTAAAGADSPATIASIIVAVAILGGGPRLLTATRRRALPDAAG